MEEKKELIEPVEAEVKESTEEQPKLDPKVAERLRATIRANLIESARKCRSVTRAFKRYHLNNLGAYINPKPFNNRANTSKRKGVHSRVVNQYKKRVYEGIKRRAAEKSVQ